MIPIPPPVDRPEPSQTGDERATLAGFLDWQRATLLMKCSGLTVEQLRMRAVTPSSLSLLGLVRHLAEVERGWFRRTAAGLDAPYRWHGPDTPEAEFDVETADAAEAFAYWHEECDFAREFIAGAESLDLLAKVDRPTGPRNLRWIMLHMIEEYARHNGHADLLRERIDGATGE